MYRSGQYTVAAIAEALGVSRASIYRHLTPQQSLTNSFQWGRMLEGKPYAPDLLHAIYGMPS
jgi:AcrR family transcriptional regulator